MPIAAHFPCDPFEELRLEAIIHRRVRGYQQHNEVLTNAVTFLGGVKAKSRDNIYNERSLEKS